MSRERAPGPRLAATSLGQRPVLGRLDGGKETAYFESQCICFEIIIAALLFAGVKKAANMAGIAKESQFIFCLGQ
jgi:hypothetical protein